MNFYISFTLYPAHSWVDRGNLVLKQSVPHFPPNPEGIVCSFPRMGIEPITIRDYNHTLVPLRHDYHKEFLNEINKN